MASVFFYMYFVPAYILVLLFLICFDYFLAILINNNPKKGKQFLILSLFGNIVILALFKYLNLSHFHFNGINELIGYDYIILPLGLSFHTFQSMSYVIEVYRRRQKVQKKFGIYALYVMFYPQLIAGPIERPGNMLHQFFEKHKFNYANLTSGLKMMLWGFFKKLVIADNLAIFVNDIYNSPKDYHAGTLLIATLLFSIQIYCDFSAYSDIALGAARTMGFNLTKNFNNPYFASSIEEFWRKWHISLSSWFRDYIYIPLGGNRVKISRQYLNLLIVFIICGIWHGLGLTYIIWGFLHGAALIFVRATKEIRQSLFKFSKNIKITITFLFVSIAWIFFRAANLNDALYILSRIILIPFDLVRNIPNLRLVDPAIFIEELFGNRMSNKLLIAIFISTVLWYCHLFRGIENFMDFTSRQKKVLRWSILAIISLTIINLGAKAEKAFIYFQF